MNAQDIAEAIERISRLAQTDADGMLSSSDPRDRSNGAQIVVVCHLLSRHRTLVARTLAPHLGRVRR